MITQLRNKETGFSLLELSVAVGVAAIVAAGAITATTTFIGSAQDKRDGYVSNAETSISNAESSSLALGAAGVVEETPVFVYEGFNPTNNILSVSMAGESLQFYAETGDTWAPADGDGWNGGPVMILYLGNANDGGHVLGNLDNNNAHLDTDGFYYLEDPDGNYTWLTPNTQDGTANQWTDSGTGNIYLGYSEGQLRYLAMYFSEDYALGGTPQPNTNW